jgi:hypothetical protein
MTYEDIEGEAAATLEKTLHDQYWAFLMRSGFSPKLIIHTPWGKKSRGVVVGFPDFLVMRDNKTFLIEFKTGKNTTSKEQDDVIHILRDNGFTVCVLWTLEAAQRETKIFFNL